MNKTNNTNAPQTSTCAGGYTALGTIGGKLVVLTSLDKAVVKVAPTDLSELNLRQLCGAEWCDQNYTRFDEKKKANIFDHRELATDIIRDCQAKGPYNESSERRTGVWLMEDGHLAVNSREMWRADGHVPHGVHGRHVYPHSSAIGFEFGTPQATDDDVRLVLDAFGSLRWDHSLAAELILGWLGVALVSTAVRRRPHVLLTGPAGCGKSTILESVKWLLGPLAFACTGPQTMAGYYQQLGGTSRAAIVDEFEADPAKKGCRDTFEIARMSYSLQEGDSGIVRGTTSGTARSYRFFSPFIAAGISPGKMEPADLTRWVVLEAKGRKSDAVQLTEAQARDIGPRLARRFIDRWDIYKLSEEVVRKEVLRAGGDGRMADTVGTLLASYWTFVKDRPATTDDAAELVSRLDIKERLEIHAVSDEQRCLEALLSKVMPFRYIQGIYEVTRNLSIGEAVKRVCDDPAGNPEIMSRLAQLGMRVVLVNGTWKLYVVNSPEHQELRKVFAGTKWSTGGWGIVLRRLAGGQESTQRMGVGFGAAKVTMFEVPQDLQPTNEHEFLDAA
ncbi:ATP-binding protein [Variovorax ureilyticus]|uniref:ATP-binding protein n=1 Tax=Variovorax ureilyticus TaxID=1836198 RepID=UPI003D6729AB